MKLTPTPIRKLVGKLCERLELTLDDLSEQINEDPSSFEREFNATLGPRLKTLSKLANWMDVTVDSLVAGEVDFDWVESRYRQEVVLPERYRVATGSLLRTTLPMLLYVREHWGEALYRNVLRQLRISPEVFNNPEQRVSIRLPLDVLDILGNRGFNDSELLDMGRGTPYLPANHAIAKHFTGVDSHRHLYELACEEIVRKYEWNCDYQLTRLSARSATVRITPRAEMQEALGQEIIDSRRACVCRQGVIAAHPVYASLSPAQVRELACVHHGDASCDYEMTW